MIDFIMIEDCSYQCKALSVPTALERRTKTFWSLSILKLFENKMNFLTVNERSSFIENVLTFFFNF